MDEIFLILIDKFLKTKRSEEIANAMVTFSTKEPSFVKYFVVSLIDGQESRETKVLIIAFGRDVIATFRDKLSGFKAFDIEKLYAVAHSHA